tara:strand:- start:294 stop:527 length:234 start_codon:yes stop_codon:yes gene_type:complete
MLFEEGMKVKGIYVGRYDFQGTVYKTEDSVVVEGQNLYIELDEAIKVGRKDSVRTYIMVNTEQDFVKPIENKKVLDK